MTNTSWRLVHEEEDEAERPRLNISQEQLCFLIVKAREFDALVPCSDGESASNPSDDQSVSVLEEESGQSVEEELRGALDSLNDDERIALLALVWLGRGDYEPEDWGRAVEDAGNVHDWRETSYLLGIPQLGDLLEEGLAKLGYGVQEYEVGRL